MTKIEAAKAMHEADDKWQDMIFAMFGHDAYNARYDERGRGEDGSVLRAAYDARLAAIRKWQSI